MYQKVIINTNIPYRELRNFVYWEKTDMSHIPVTKHISIRDIDTPYLEFLIEKKFGDDYYKLLFIRELQYRMIDEEKV